MGVLSEHFTLVNGVTIPKLGFGTWQTPNDGASAAVQSALRAGYTHIDTARGYENEAGVGAGIRASGLPRDAVFVTTKVPAQMKSYDEAKAAIARSLAELQMASVDLLLIHAPKPWPEMPDGPHPYFEENVAVWRALEEAYAAGQARSIGVSNFQIADIENVTAHCTVAPMANQIRFHIGYTQPDLVAYCQAHNILVEAYSPIGTGRLLGNATIAQVGEKYGKSVAQVCIRYALEKGTLPLPKSVHDAYIAANTDIDFELTPADMATLDALTE
ncbi:MAG: aldo/keto reductase [Propionibacteriaceae bacterium]|jgi:diketogulonate reductase-like aldo/keto reductase|nr:aldo/keto reductase [Propionibacteriaceae bacterium]